MAEEITGSLKKIKEMLIEGNDKFLADQAKNADTIRAKDQVETGKVNKSTTEAAKNNQTLMEETFAKMSKEFAKPLIEGANFSAMHLKEQLVLQNKMSDIFSNVAPDGMASALKELAGEVSHLPGAVKMLTDAAKTAKGNDSKIDKLKAKEAKQDKKKTNDAAFKDAVKGVKDFGKSAFDKIKGMLIKGALILALTQVGKFLNSDAWVKIKAFIIDTLIPLLGNIWDNVLKPLFNGILDVFSIIVDLLSGDMDSALQTFKDNWMIITPLIAGVLIALAVYLFGVITTMKSVLIGAFIAMKPMLIAAAPFLLAAAALAAIFFGIKYLLEELGLSLDFGGVKDLIMIGVGYLMDAFAMIANIYIDIANFVIKKLSSVAKFFGIDLDFGPIGKMSTNNAAIAIEKGQANARIKAAEKEMAEAKEEKQQTSAAINGGGGGAVMANNNNTTVNQSSTTQVMPSPMPDMTQFANYGEVQLA
jgi:hypothetical protein